jgi:hypothetical protein
MNTFNLPRRGNTYRDDFNSWQPAWRTVIAAALSPLRPVLRRLRSYLRHRASVSPPLGDHIRRDIGLPPAGEAPQVTPPDGWPLFR